MDMCYGVSYLLMLARDLWRAVHCADCKLLNNILFILSWYRMFQYKNRTAEWVSKQFIGKCIEYNFLTIHFFWHLIFYTRYIVLECPEIVN